MAYVTGNVRTVLRLEGLCILLLALVFYQRSGESWSLFAWMFLSPDLAFFVYLINSRVGAIAYNCTHSLIGAIALLVISMMIENNLYLAISLIWFAHIGFDRALGYGLKYGKSFNDTHLGRVGRKQIAAE